MHPYFIFSFGWRGLAFSWFINAFFIDFFIQSYITFVNDSLSWPKQQRVSWFLNDYVRYFHYWRLLLRVFLWLDVYSDWLCEAIIIILLLWNANTLSFLRIRWLFHYFRKISLSMWYVVRVSIIDYLKGIVLSDRHIFVGITRLLNQIWMLLLFVTLEKVETFDRLNRGCGSRKSRCCYSLLVVWDVVLDLPHQILVVIHSKGVLNVN